MKRVRGRHGVAGKFSYEFFFVAKIPVSQKYKSQLNFNQESSFRSTTEFSGRKDERLLFPL